MISQIFFSWIYKNLTLYWKNTSYWSVRVSNNLAAGPGWSPASARRHLGLTPATHATRSVGASLIENGWMSGVVLRANTKENNVIFTGKGTRYIFTNCCCRCVIGNILAALWKPTLSTPWHCVHNRHWSVAQMQSTISTCIELIYELDHD